MSGYHGVSHYAKFALLLLVVTGLMLIISFASPYWTTRRDGNMGLWIACTGVSTARVCYQRWNLWVAGWVHAVQFMMSVGLTAWIFSTVCLFSYVFLKYFDEDKRMVVLSGLLALFAGVCILLSVLTWVAGQHFGDSEILNWPYGLAWISACVSFMVVGVLYKEMQNQPHLNEHALLSDV